MSEAPMSEAPTTPTATTATPARGAPRSTWAAIGCVLLSAGCACVFCGFCTLMGAAPLVVSNFRMDGASMAPTIERGQYLLVSRAPYWFGGPHRGDVVVHSAWNTDRTFVKRIVGLPGEEVEIRDGQVFIDGRVLEEDYLTEPTLDHIGPARLSSDDYYVMGDNRANSSDSRVYGPLPRDQIWGKALLVYWPLPQAHAIEHRDIELGD